MKSLLRHLPGGRAVSPAWNDPAPVRGERFGIERLEQHATSLAVEQIDRAITWSFGAVILPGLELADGVPRSLRTLVAVPTLSTSEADLLEQVELSRTLGASRTPLREALNRLSVEGLLRFVPGKGYFCRDLDVHEVFHLYELRKVIEVAALHLAVERARDADIESLLAFLGETGLDPGERSVVDLVLLDEMFHERLLTMSGNVQMLRVLANVNARIRFVRWIDMERADRRKTQMEHRNVQLGLKRRDLARCTTILERHIDRRLDAITSALKEGYAQIYLPKDVQRGARG
jgi:DNA-binding GntR family transcriptional regulator